MTANELSYLLAQAIFVLIAAITAARAVRRPSRANVDTALLFGTLAVFVLLGQAEEHFGFNPWPVPAIEIALLVSLPYFLFRLVDDFSAVTPSLYRSVTVYFVALMIATAYAAGTSEDLPNWYLITAGGWFIALNLYATAAFALESRRTRGVTRRRMQAAAWGSVFFAAVIAAVVAAVFIPVIDEATSVLVPLLALGTAIAYLTAFAPPAILRRSWQEPELRAFLARAASLPRLPQMSDVVRELERGAAESTGAPHAAIALWDAEAQLLRWQSADADTMAPAGGGLAGRALSSGQPIFSFNAPADDPANAEMYRAYSAKAVLAAPINAGAKHIGVLTVYAPRPPIFDVDDLELVTLLADQSAVVLESRALIDEASHVQAMKESTRLKDDFLSVAAHDLKTPLTNIIGRAQLIEMRLQRDPDSRVDINKVKVIVDEGERMRDLIVALLDSSRQREEPDDGPRETVDLRALFVEEAERHCDERHACEVQPGEAVLVNVDPLRVSQLIGNLLDNAIKYSPAGGTVRVEVWEADSEAHAVVADSGIGIPADDLPHIFDRFQRASNADDRRFGGMGLGLFICREVVREHGGRIWATSSPGVGSRFHFALPLARPRVTQ